MEKVLRFGSPVVTFGQQLHHHQQSIETLKTEMKQVTAALNQLYFDMRRMQDEFRHVQDNERNEREKLLLQLEIERLIAVPKSNVL